MLVDLHTHTSPASYDALQSTEELALEARGLGIDALCLTEHDAFWDPAKLRALSSRHRILLIPGCELNTDQGHFLAFGLTEYIFGMHKLPFLRRIVNKAGGVLVAAHPYRRRRKAPLNGGPDQSLDRALREATFAHCDAMEGLNGRGSLEDNAFSEKLAKGLGLKTTGGSDSHQAGDLGTCATRFENVIWGLDDLIRELKGGRFEALPLGKSRRS